MYVHIGCAQSILYTRIQSLEDGRVWFLSGHDLSIAGNPCTMHILIGGQLPVAAKTAF